MCTCNPEDDTQSLFISAIGGRTFKEERQGIIAPTQTAQVVNVAPGTFGSSVVERKRNATALAWCQVPMVPLGSPHSLLPSVKWQ
jgi:hypothetical protein